MKGNIWETLKTWLIILPLFLIETAFVAAMSIAVYKDFQEDDSRKYDARTEYLKEMQAGYDGAFYFLVAETQHYIDSIAPSSALRALPLCQECIERKIDLPFVLAQADIESRFGTRGLAKRTNSVWNIGAFDGLKESKVARYSHPNMSIRPYLRILEERYLNNKSIEDLMLKYEDRDGKRYASDPLYEQKLRTKYDEILSSTKIMSLQDDVYFYKSRM